MLIDYLRRNFLTETEFADRAGWDMCRLRNAMQARIMPGPSYRLAGSVQVHSFLSDCAMPLQEAFHLTGHLRWAALLDQLGVAAEDQARRLFMTQYRAAQRALEISPLGEKLLAGVPGILDRFDAAHEDATWGHFLNGVYGLCTRDGAPETIFRKQIGVMIVEALTKAPPADISPEGTALLAKAVSFLDHVASDFAPHERPISSRQRCITDIHMAYLGASAGDTLPT